MFNNFRSDRNDRRGARGHGRGGHAGKERPGLIESSGIFSEGLSGADPSRRKIKLESSEDCQFSTGFSYDDVLILFA